MRQSQLFTTPAIFCALMFASLSGPAFAGMEHACSVVKCAAGDKATTYAKKSDPYFACSSRELSEYTNFVLGLFAVSLQLTGHFPNISPKTGDPEYLDGASGPNGARLLLDQLRTEAGVRTFDQAMAACSQGKNGVRVTIMNIRKDSGSAWVQEDKSKTTFWLPNSSLDKR